MPSYRVDVERVGGWWLITVPAIGNAVTQASNRDLVEPTARDLIAAMLDVDPGSIDIDVTSSPVEHT